MKQIKARKYGIRLKKILQRQVGGKWKRNTINTQAIMVTTGGCYSKGARLALTF